MSFQVVFIFAVGVLATERVWARERVFHREATRTTLTKFKKSVAKTSGRICGAEAVKPRLIPQRLEKSCPCCPTSAPPNFRPL